MNAGIGIIVATLIACTTYAAVEFLTQITDNTMTVAAADNGIFVINQKTGGVTFCYKGGRDGEVWPVCKSGAVITRH